MTSIIPKKENSKITTNSRVAWLIPSMEGGSYWHPVFSEFTKIFPQTTVYTGAWSGFSPGCEESFTVKVVGEMKFVSTTQSGEGYSRGFIRVSPAIIGQLLRFKPHVVFVSGFSIWTIFALLLKPLSKWQVIIIVDGSSPNVDYRNSSIRLFLRRRMVQFTDAFITNSQGGKIYLTDVLKAKKISTFSRPYQVPTLKAMSRSSGDIEFNNRHLQQPIFLFIGQLIPRKGLHLLLKACEILQQRGYRDYTLIVIGEGSDQEELKKLSQNYGLEESVKWAGWVDYDRIGNYFQIADVFILPTLEDTWGMVVLESMAFGKPVLCSKWAGASEMVIDGENGYILDPHNTEEIADMMSRFMNAPELIASMGNKSKQMIAEHTPETVAHFLTEVTSFVLTSK